MDGLAFEAGASLRNPVKYSILSLARNARSYHERWPLAWRSPAPKPRYDAVIVGGGGHGLASAYYLAKEHGVTNIAVLEKGYLGGGNTGRNTTIVRSNYHLDANALPPVVAQDDLGGGACGVLGYLQLAREGHAVTFIDPRARGLLTTFRRKIDPRSSRLVRILF